MKRKRREVQYVLFELNNKPKKSKSSMWLYYPLFTFIFVVIIGTLSIILLSQDLPSLSQLEKIEQRLVTRIYSSDDVLLDELFLQKRIHVLLDQMPEHLIQATIASEDRKFFHHWGVDLIRFIKLAFDNVINMRIMGGASTLTQQLAKKLYLTPKKSIIRKFREQLTAIRIEKTYSKSEILELYLNHMDLGRGTYGVQAASLAYFGKNVEDLTIGESALIVGLLQLPYGYYSPDSNLVAAQKRRDVVLKTMVDCGFLEKSAYDSLIQIPLNVVPRYEADATIAPYFCEFVKRDLSRERGYGDRLWRDGLTIRTTLDTRIQACADSAVKAFLPGLQEEIRKEIIEKRRFKNWVDPPLETKEDIKAFLADTVLVDSLMHLKASLQVSLIAINPTNGNILAMIGGPDFNDWKFNNAVQAKRQPGSAFKPIAYTVAIDNGYPPFYELWNQPVVIPALGDQPAWRPHNYDHSVGGLTRLREGVYRSLNLIAVRLIQEVIPAQEVVDMAEKFGFTTKINAYDGVVLGQDVVIPLELTSAYCVFANRGVRVEPISVLSIEDKDGNILEEAVTKEHDVISAETAYIMTDMLSDVIENVRGTGHAARWKYQFTKNIQPAVAGKTGTTNDFKNAWFIGFTPQMVACVWIGFRDERISLGEDKSGAVAALPIWAPFMRMVHDSLKIPPMEFTMPAGVSRVKICAESKKLATESCEIHQNPNMQYERKNKRNRIIF
jgi:penicillin-binding protein 1A